MEIDATSMLIIIVGAGLIFWGIGRILARRIPPWRRGSWAIMVTLMIVVALVVGNNLFPFLPRGYLRLLLMFSCVGWVFGVVGYRD